MKILASNKKASFDYHLLDTLETGIRLTGAEVKSLKSGNASMTGTFVLVENGQLILKNLHIGPYAPARVENYDPKRDRILLAHQKEILRLEHAREKEGLTIVPTKIYLAGSLIKVEVATAKGKKKYDKRETIKNRDVERELRR